MTETRQSVWDAVGVALRGFVMGIAEVLPGISGGTIALLTGIYERLVGSLADLSVGFANLVRRRADGFKFLLQPSRFMVPLGLGMVVGFGATTLSVVHLLESQPLLIWGAIFGIVLGAVGFTAVESRWKNIGLFAPVGLVFALALSFLPSAQGEAPLLVVYIGAVLAFGAWILPGISGSFVLLIMGVWTTMVHAFASLELLTIAVFLGGLATGWFVFSHPVRLLVDRHRPIVMAVFCGLLAGSLWRLWPWQVSDSPVLPTDFSGDPALLVVVPAMCGGVLLVSVLTYAKVRNSS